MIHNFQEQRPTVCFSLSAFFQKVSRDTERWTEREIMEGVGVGGTHLLTEDQLVIKQEEDSLLATSIRLIDP